LFKNFETGEKRQAFIAGLAKNSSAQNVSVLATLTPHIAKFATEADFERFGKGVYLGSNKSESEIKENISDMFKAIGDIDEACQRAFIAGLAKNYYAQDVHVLTALMSSSLAKFAANDDLRRFGEKVDLKPSNVGMLFETIGNIEEDKNHLLKKAFMEGLLNKDGYNLKAYVLTALMSSSLGNFVTNTHFEKFGEKANLWSLHDVGELFEAIEQLERDGNHLLKKAFIAGLAENYCARRNVPVLTALMSSSLGKFVTNAHWDKFGEKINLLSLPDVDELFAAFGNGEEAKERKKAFQKGATSNSQINSWLKEYMNKFIVEGK
jgi:hypothetical protein